MQSQALSRQLSPTEIDPSCRFTLFTPEVRERIVLAISKGATHRLAAKAGGVSARTLKNWLTKGEEEESGDFHQFWLACEDAEQEHALGILEELHETAKATKSVAGLTWILEHRYGSDFRKKNVIEGDPDAPVEVKHTIKIAREAPTVKVVEAPEVVAALAEPDDTVEGDWADIDAADDED